MCGISGWIGNGKRDKVQKALNRMADAVLWRGPDGKGIYIDETDEGIVGLAHRRLSIVDLSDNGKQPMTGGNGRYALTYNGEVYNYRDLRGKLEKKAHHFISDCDTEVVLHACMEWGVEEAASKFNGMWGFAFYDREDGTITLCRDRLGVKPLYYTKTDHYFSFASDIRSIHSCTGQAMTIDVKALHGYLWNMYIPSPYSIYKEVQKVPPGGIVKYSIKNKCIMKGRYWDLPQCGAGQAGISYKEYLYGVKKTLTEAVQLRMVADVPVGVFLSGGVDSSLIAAISQQYSESGIKTFSIGFSDKENDDARFALEAAQRLGTSHTQLYCSAADARTLIQNIPVAYSEPFADNSQIPTMLLSKLTRQYVTVALSGDGGDEFFVGYPYYIDNVRIGRMAFLLRLLSTPARKLVDSVLPLYSHKRWKIDKLGSIRNTTALLNRDYVTAAALINSLLPGSYRNFDNRQLQEYLFYYGGCEYEGRKVLDASLRHSIHYGLTDDMLVKVDRGSMFYSLEVRSPFLDCQVVEAAMQIPFSYKIPKLRLKAILKDILSDYLPDEIINRPKSGFGVPINTWIHGEWNEMINDYLCDSFIKRQGIFDPSGMLSFVNELNKRRNPILDRLGYTLLVFQLWWEKYEGSHGYRSCRSI